MDARQDELSNPFGMDEDCRNCPALCDTREQVVHGYGDVGADFLVVGEAPDAGADREGIPFAGAEGRAVWRVLERLALCEDADADRPDVENVFLTHLTRCRADRAPTDEELANCEPFLSAEIRMINPEILVPVGQRPLRELAAEYTTTPAEEFSVSEDNGREVRGRGFELVPMAHPADADEETVEEFLEAFSELLGRDYRQTKGRRGR